MPIKRKIKKVMLIFPTGKVLKGHFQHCEIPLGLAYLASVLRNDFAVKVFDGRAKFQKFAQQKSKWEYFGFRQEEIIKEVISFAPDIAGVSCLSSFHFPEARSLCQAIKKIDNGILTAVGGTHPTFLANEIMPKCKEIDFIILGEGEESFLQLLLCINSGKDYSLIDGLAFRGNGNYFVNPKTKFIENLDKLPFPAVDLFPFDFYRKKSIPFSVTFRNRKTMPLLTSRGCPAKCIFCSSRNYWGNVYRKRSAKNVLDEIEYYITKFKVKEIQFIDDNLTQDKERARQIFKGMIERKFNISWNTPNGIAIWTIDQKMLELMKESGCYELTIAFESGVQEVLTKIIQKPINLKKVEELVRQMRKLRIQIHSFFISGFPGETKEQILETFAFARKMDLDSAWFFMANPTPGSELYKVCKEKGYLKNDFCFDEIEYNLPQIQTNDFTPRQIEKLVLMQFNSYNLGLFFRHPLRFIKKYLKMFLAHPVMSFKTVFSDLVRIIGK